MGVHWKIWFFLGGGVCELKEQFADLRSGGEGAWRKRGGRYFWRQSACHDITRWAVSQTSKIFSENDCMTAEFYKNIYQANNFRLKILGNKRVLEKTQIGWRQMQVPSQPSSNKFLVIVVKIYTEADSKFSSIVQFCLIFLLSSKYFIQDVRCLLFLGIQCELQEKKLYLKTFKNLTPKTRNSIINYHQTAATQGKILQYSFFTIPLMSPTHPIKLY